MEKEYMVMDDTEYSSGKCIVPEIDEESEKIIDEVMRKYNLTENN